MGVADVAAHGCEKSGHGWWETVEVYDEGLVYEAYVVCVYCGHFPNPDEDIEATGLDVEEVFVEERRFQRRLLRSYATRKPHGIPRKRGQDSHRYRPLCEYLPCYICNGGISRKR